ncbi:4-hydroxybenzoate polyprenyltransferase [Cohaesibacter sp. ES.047]|uniref:4-hydroxybenzoate octaprenyltransferase n=1 Tax=Cohaesibacter sp. ES.047 TaxID=1798205 RepID=UPI000BC0BD50|nr:4-hydroxybenzoate octaprenyltransferase [Cohaesibacter sp. ES.047]SNY92511.1 4-hydroxybenzoate polyprenyltransferase [Cohaesibacter sp. ES.047]
MSEQFQAKHDMDVPKGQVADAVRDHWVDIWLPEVFRPYARLSRLERPIGWWLLLWPCLWSMTLAVSTTDRAHHPDALTILWFGFVFWLGAVAMRGAGCTYNDLVDHKIDGMVERTRSRPLPSKQVTRLHAWGWLAFQALVGLFVLLQFNSYTIALGFASLGVVAIYPFMKRITHWPQLVLGLAFSWGGLVGWTAITGELALAPLLMYVACAVWTIGFDTIYAHQDKEDDVMIGVKSTALLFADNTKIWLMFFYGVMVVFMASALVSSGVSWPAFVGLGAATLHMGWQIWKLDIHDAEQCLALFRSNTQIGWLLFVGLLASLWV